MAQCEAEGRKHPTMDLYVGIFNSKLYGSNRGSPRMSAADKRSKHSFNSTSTTVENAREGAVLSGKNSFPSRSFADLKQKPPVLSNYASSNRQLTSLSNVGYTRCDMRSSSMNVSDVKKSSAPNISVGKMSSSLDDVVCGVKNLQTNIGDDAGHLEKEIKTGVNNVDHLWSGASIIKTNVGFLGSGESGASADVGAGVYEKSMTADIVSSGNDFPHVQIDGRYKFKESTKSAVCALIEKNHGTTHINKSPNHEGNQTKVANEALPEEGFSTTQQLVDETSDQEQYPGSRVNHNFSSPHNANGLNSMKIRRTTEGVSGDQIDVGCLQGNGYARKNHEHQVATGSSLSCGGGLTKPDEAGDSFAARRSVSPTSEVLKFGLKNASMALPVSTSDVEGMPRSLLPGDTIPGLEMKNHYTNRLQPQEHNVGVLQARGHCSSNAGGMPAGDRSIVGVANTNKFAKSYTADEVESIANEIALKESPSRAHSLVANLRVVGSPSTDSSSSHGGSSHSGSPTASESHRDSRVSTFGNILLSKGSPRSASSRSMGSASISGHGSFTPSRTSFFDSPATQFRYCTSSGRKSAELVPNRRYSEIVPNRKSSEMMSNGHGRGLAMQGLEGNATCGFANSSRGTGNMDNGNNASLNNGNLLVGSVNGNVRTVGGAIKSNSKQRDVVNHSVVVDYTLLKKAQASSDPEEIKNAGNEYYRRGHFSEALMLYTKAVSLWPNNVAYRSNRAAAFTAMGRLGEAVKECEDAIRLDSSNIRSHQRVISLYLRLGLLERAKQHLNAAGQQTDALELQRLHTIDEHMCRCIEARKREEWQNMIRESDAAVVAGADSSPQVFGYKAEALLGLRRPDDADAVCTAAQRVESSLVKSGVILADPFLLIVRAQVEMALGRFDGALAAAKSAAKLDPSNKHISALLTKAQAICHTRTTGNELFKAGRFFEALALYAEGLESDPMNAVLLCNRAACRSKLGQWEKSVEDCDAALRIQPNYTKALMRRANCWIKLERWEEALLDYELLRRKMPEDLEIARGLFDVQVAMKKLQGEDTHKMKFGGDVEEVLTDEQFQDAISSPGLSVVQFVTKWSDRCRKLAPFVDDLCKRNPCVNFLRVDVEGNPYLAKFECVSFVPTFKIYKGGQKVKEIMGPTEQSLEYALNHYTL